MGMKLAIRLRNILLPIILAALFSTVPAYSGDYPQSETLLETSRTVIGEQIHYPGGGPASIKAMVVVLPPGGSTTWHKHGVPLYAYILSGDLDVDYGQAGHRIYHPGDSFMEAMDTFHQGHNSGHEIVRILAVFMGGEGQPLVIPKDP